MFRTCLCLLLAFASAGVTAREVKMSSANGGSCTDGVAEKTTAVASVRKSPPPAREVRAKTGASADAVGNGRVQSPRWNSFLPGMFR